MVQSVDGKTLAAMLVRASASLNAEKQKINELNVFPVPDGDTGTNMGLTLGTAAAELRQKAPTTAAQASALCASAMLRGARGNSGVILSLIFRGFSRAMKDKDTMDGIDLADALNAGVVAAYKAVMKPAEGTVLTVSRLAGDRAGRAAEENTVVIGCDVYAPYTYKDGTGDFIGIDVQLAHEAFGRLGYDVEFREIAWENKDKALASGEVDCIWSCFTMNEREDVYTWAGPYLYSRQVALVRADSDYTELSQLAGKRAAVQASTTAEKALLRRENPNVPEMKQVLCFSTIGEAVSALRKGYVDMVVAHESVIQSVVHGSPEKYRMLDQTLFANELGVAFEKGTHEALAARLQAVIDDMRGDGSAEAIVASYGLDAKKMLEGN